MFQKHMNMIFICCRMNILTVIYSFLKPSPYLDMQTRILPRTTTSRSAARLSVEIGDVAGDVCDD